MICRKKSEGHRASNKNIRRSSYHKGYQLYILLNFDSVRALEIHDVRATSCLACALEMRSSHGANVLKDVRAHCYCAFLVRTLFIRHARAKTFSRARTESKTQQNIELVTFALTWCANIFVGCLVTPTFFFGRSLPFLILSIILKNKKICTWEGLIIPHLLFT